MCRISRLRCSGTSRLAACARVRGIVAIGMACLLPPAGVAGHPPFRVLLFTRTLEFRHDSIPDGIALIEALAAQNDFVVDATEDPAAFSVENLSRYAVTVWLSTTGDVLDPAQQAAFQSYLETGGGWVGVHAAADCEYDWPWYGQLLGNGAWFYSHPAIQPATLAVEAPQHISTRHLPAAFSFTDEWYNFAANPRPAVNVLLTIDETSYAPGFGAMGADHPISWCHAVGAGRAWYTAMGHPSETYADSRFQQHLAGGILWAARARLPGDANCDRRVDFFDVDPFVLALLDPPAYSTEFAECDLARSDVNADGRVDFFDIDPFVTCLFSGCD